MATMSIQLRRVVYLLVLLQCCACVVSADGMGDTSKNTVAPETTIKQEAGIAERRLQELVNQAYGLYLAGKSCVAVLKNETAVCEKHKDNAKKAAEKTKNAVDALENKLEVKDKVIEQPIPVEKIKELRGVAEEAKKHITESKEALEKETAMLQKKKYALTACWASFGDLSDVVPKLNASRDGLESFMDEHSTPERLNLIKNATATGGELFWLTQEVGLALGRGQGIKREAETEMRDADRMLQDTLKKLEKIVAQVKKVGAEGVERTRVDGFHEFQTDVNETAKLLNETAAISSSIVEPAPGVLMSGARSYEDAVARDDELYPERKKKRDFEEKRKGVAMAEIKKELKEAEMEAARLLAEKLIREENERRIAEERKRQEKLAEEERKRREKLAEEERKRREKLAEEERKKQEKLAEEERKKQEKLAEEEKAKRAAEKARLEAERLVKEKAKKNKRDGSSPALMHGPILLLLLCVLGCTLVC
ncbi:uncharacterized protein TM35_000971040 [Trypanosoma theileri]|uniref:Uncharacterized protein n=1 Tax=Trypanosoma theileri TaxID=67003 RepID=A0A1X0NEB3_9TRYP|nr:uncharacterized protein TM35_000971040 [Trypanosoma theileri]ORC82116.1 hypothetical protein TM35_000971040 [Trypanosoma theileri]